MTPDKIGTLGQLFSAPYLFELLAVTLVMAAVYMLAARAHFQVMQQCSYRTGCELSVCPFQLQDLMAGIFDGSRFMEAHMACFGRNHTLVWFEQGINGNHIGLRATCQKENICIGSPTGSPNLFFGGLGKFIKAVARLRNKIGFN